MPVGDCGAAATAPCYTVSVSYLRLSYREFQRLASLLLSRAFLGGVSTTIRTRPPFTPKEWAAAAACTVKLTTGHQQNAHRDQRDSQNQYTQRDEKQ